MTHSAHLSLAVAALAAVLVPAPRAQETPHPQHAHGTTEAQAGSSALEADPPSIDFGEAFEGERLHREVIFTNVTDEPWPVSRIQTSCGCTVAKLFGPEGEELPTRPRGTDPIVVVGPGETIRTDVEFNTTGKHGRVQQRMQVYSTDSRLSPASVPVQVQVNRALQVNPRWVNLGNVTKSERIEQIVTLESLPAIGAWKIKGFTSQVEGQELPAWLAFEALDTEGQNRRVKVVIDGTKEGGLPVGSISPRVRVKIEHERIDAVDFTITGIVKSNVVFSSGNAQFQENLNFEQLTPDQKVTRTLTITNKDPEVPYLLEGVDLLTPQKEFFTYEIETIEEGVTYKVDLTVDGAIDAPFFRGSLVLRAQHPDEPSKPIPFHGWVRK